MSIPLPALGINPPAQQPGPMEQYGKAIALKSLLSRQQLEQGEQQIQAQHIQEGAIQLQDQKAMTAAMHEWDGKDIDALPPLIVKHGGSANAVMGMKQKALTYKTDLQKMTKDQLENESTIGDVVAQHIDNVKSLPPEKQPEAFEAAKSDLVQKGYLDPQHAQVLQYPGPEGLELLEKTFLGHKAAVEAAAKQAETAKAGAQQAEAEQTTLMKQAELNWKKEHGMAPGVTPDEASFGAYLSKGGKPEQYAGYKAGIEAKGRQPFELELARARELTAQAIQGMVKPVYAFHPDGSKELMSQTDAQRSGVKTMLPVTDKEVTDDTMLSNRLGDVHQKISQYEQALKKPIDQPDRAAIASLISTGKFKVGLFGTEITMDTVKNLSKQMDIKVLSPEARDLLVSYYNAREAMTGYNRVLTGTGRSNQQNLQLQLDTLPDPAATDADYAQRSLGAFKQNLQVIGQGIPKIPGVKKPEEWEQGATKQAAPQQSNSSSGWGAQFGGVPHQ